MHVAKKILIVEDDAGIREGLQELLEDEGYSVDIASNGLEAMERLVPPPAIILLDLMMPRMDGAEFLLAFRRERPDLADALPVILLTAAKGERAAGLSGIRSVIHKPVDVEVLLTQLNSL